MNIEKNKVKNIRAGVPDKIQCLVDSMAVVSFIFFIANSLIRLRR